MNAKSILERLTKEVKRDFDKYIKDFPKGEGVHFKVRVKPISFWEEGGRYSCQIYVDAKVPDEFHKHPVEKDWDVYLSVDAKQIRVVTEHDMGKKHGIGSKPKEFFALGKVTQAADYALKGLQDAFERARKLTEKQQGKKASQAVRLAELRRLRASRYPDPNTISPEDAVDILDEIKERATNAVELMEQDVRDAEKRYQRASAALRTWKWSELQKHSAIDGIDAHFASEVSAMYS